MNAWIDPTVEEIVFKKCARIGGTSVIENLMAYCIDVDPGPMMTVQPTLEDAEDFSKENFEPLIRDTPVLAARIDERKSRRTDNKILRKKFPGGYWVGVGANAPRGLRRRTIRYLFIDEASGCAASAGKEGDPIKLAKNRTVTFWNRKMYMASTPTVEGECKISAEYEETDQREYHVPCRHCGHEQPLKWSNLKFDEGGADPRYECRECGGIMRESDKRELLAAGRWIAAFPERRKRGYWINVLYSPFYSWEKVVADFLSLKRTYEGKKVFANTYLGETWHEEAERIDSNVLHARREAYTAEVPWGVCVLTAGIDVQGNRIEVSVWGWGLQEEAWLIEHQVFDGDPTQKRVWAEVQAYLESGFRHESGIDLRIFATFVDSGAFTTHVYDFVAPLVERRVFPIKGSPQHAYPLVGKPSRVGRRKQPLYNLGTSSAKDVLFARLRYPMPAESAFPPGFIHLPDTVGLDYCEQLTAEKAVLRYVRGVAFREYKKEGRNEALDCLVYAYAAKHAFPIDFEAIAAQFESKRLESETKADDSPPKPPAARRKKGGWLNGWRN